VPPSYRVQMPASRRQKAIGVSTSEPGPECEPPSKSRRRPARSWTWPMIRRILLQRTSSARRKTQGPAPGGTLNQRYVKRPISAHERARIPCGNSFKAGLNAPVLTRLSRMTRIYATSRSMSNLPGHEPRQRHRQCPGKDHPRVNKRSVQVHPVDLQGFIQKSTTESKTLGNDFAREPRFD